MFKAKIKSKTPYHNVKFTNGDENYVIRFHKVSESGENLYKNFTYNEIDKQDNRGCWTEKSLTLQFEKGGWTRL